jgi:hypothetical protein
MLSTRSMQLGGEAHFRVLRLKASDSHFAYSELTLRPQCDRRINSESTQGECFRYSEISSDICPVVGSRSGTRLLELVVFRGRSDLRRFFSHWVFPAVVSGLGVLAWVSFAFGLTPVGGLGAWFGVQHTLPRRPGPASSVSCRF